MRREDDLREMRKEIERIKDRIDDIGHVQVQQVKADGRVREELLSYFEGKAARTNARIYLAVDGRRSVTEIATAVGVHPGTVSKRGAAMYEAGLLSWQDVNGTKVYHKSRLDAALRLTRTIKAIADGS